MAFRSVKEEKCKMGKGLILSDQSPCTVSSRPLGVLASSLLRGKYSETGDLAARAVTRGSSSGRNVIFLVPWWTSLSV